jgi:hypothetical protein
MCRILMKSSLEEWPLGRLGRRWEYNIKMDLKERTVRLGSGCKLL